ncbi:hypothetical protein [Pinisolibacter aquiterrae]|uniref:hypothetical protein n=1 Tax=Pinisolibacter aquiterrae TaxID=2815579 RepID=UPI001C3E5AA6|nr:hypothetical protein [Pinisolibacter aquiterrae]MBV5266083.1 hypothetical protein [Pinisolibacter aquiterrae]MCC8233624.1 hypothetical protein [Pinisolibacter aquiterrae]
MARKKSSSPSSDVEKPPKTGRTRPLPAGVASGFRRLSSFPKAALVSTLAPLLDPGEVASVRHGAQALGQVEPTSRPITTDVPRVSARAAEALRRLDETARVLPIDRQRMSRLDDEPASIRFMLGLDVEDPSGRWRAVVSRAFARADAVARCLAEGIEDDAALVDWAIGGGKSLLRSEGRP